MGARLLTTQQRRHIGLTHVFVYSLLPRTWCHQRTVTFLKPRLLPPFSPLPAPGLKRTPARRTQVLHVTLRFMYVKYQLYLGASFTPDTPVFGRRKFPRL